jgi:hypothetical protein
VKQLLIVPIVFLLVSCQQPETTIIEKPAPVVDTKPVTVLNSFWQVVKTDSLSRAIDSTEAIESDIDKHNKETKDNKWFLYVGEYPDLENAPPSDIFICDPKTNIPIEYSDGVGGKIVLKWEKWPRKKLVENIDGWRQDAARWNAVLYIDEIPPVITPDPVIEDLYTKYTINVITNSGNVKYVEHCTNTFRAADWPGYTLETFFNVRVQSWQYEAQNNATEDAPWHVETGKVYE